MASTPSDPASPQGIRRRELLLGTLAAGFAVAVRPISAATITTDAGGLTEGFVSIPVEACTIPAYRARPATGTNLPVVLVVQEIFGVHAHIQDVCRRLARLGYLAIAPSLFERQGDVTKLPDIASIRPVVAKVPDAQVMSDLDATVVWAGLAGGGDTGKLGITGFCWGGRITWLYAAHNPSLKAGVAWYGRLVGESTPEQPSYPLDLVASIKAPVLGLYGGKDDGIPLETVERMQAALKAAGSRSEIVIYPEAPHGFHADYRPSYRPEAAADGWSRLQAWFKANGVA
ncbi:dienelactone hydrolase family protein [Synechococcus sp. J7-Johnson]|uniref:dienelactone hydrolase family protein n=1 Tax=Synechococcus sp. J7-Johnson TaxID=2823737 RepID=UPI0020CC7DDC|nr:dienelactone hydrolase family protein [Synechococcus sp. J7-Johnson]MCP9841424.1 dienelactone hydrolase family protein [Synechococcus sp. J7-Johnson]